MNIICVKDLPLPSWCAVGEPPRATEKPTIDVHYFNTGVSTSMTRRSRTSTLPPRKLPVSISSA